MPPERLEFYRQYGQAIIESAIDAIDDAVTMATGEPCDPDARTTIADIIGNACKATTKIEDYVGLQLPLAAMICEEISRTKGIDLTDVVGTTVLREVNRVLKNLIAAQMDIVGDAAAKGGADLRDPKWRRRLERE